MRLKKATGQLAARSTRTLPTRSFDSPSFCRTGAGAASHTLSQAAISACAPRFVADISNMAAGCLDIIDRFEQAVRPDHADVQADVWQLLGNESRIRRQTLISCG
jgi:hypothetical protein